MELGIGTVTRLSDDSARLVSRCVKVKVKAKTKLGLGHFMVHALCFVAVILLPIFLHNKEIMYKSKYLYCILLNVRLNTHPKADS